ncbi:enoyl-ACP reductase FabI [Amycolatopsis sp. NPDC102389]|uniref:enoyl-ACP reductase FabI n=1 Tax=Amycolatopsis sp. NPDC102389 TaxID=3363941 RepID=UPI00380A47D2
MTGLLAGKRILVTGVITETSIAFHIAKIAQEQGAQVVLTGFGRLSLVNRIAQRLPEPPPVVELDVTDQDQLGMLADRVREHADGLDGVVHSIAGAPASCWGDFMGAPWPDISASLQVSAYSLNALAVAVLPLLSPGASIVGLDFDARVAWPDYDWMGVAKAALESVNRYLARDLGGRGVRTNLVASGPLRTIAAKSIPGFAEMESDWDKRAPLGWDASDPTGAAKTVCALLSDWLPATTGSMVWADGGVHAIGQ